MTNERIQQLNKFLLETPDDPFIKYAIALEYKKLGDLNQAEVHFAKTLESHSDYLPLFYHYGLTLIENSNQNKAVEIVEMGMELAKKQKDNHTLAELNELRESLEE